jgi:hypothetical protein
MNPKSLAQQLSGQVGLWQHTGQMMKMMMVVIADRCCCAHCNMPVPGALQCLRCLP